MFQFIKKVFFIRLTFLSDFTNANSLNCISMKNRECKTKPQVINVNSNNPIFHPFSIKIGNVVAIVIILMIHMQKICVPDIIKYWNVKVFNLMSRTNETRFIEWHEKCKCNWMQLFVVINNIGIKINVDVNVKN